MKKLAAKLTALLLVCLLLPLTACSPVDFSEQIQDVYSYWDFEVIVPPDLGSVLYPAGS